jgi:serine/threonine protein kinase
MASEIEDPEPSSRGAAVREMTQQDPGARTEELSQIPFEPGQVIHGKYELLRMLGVGGVGYVVAARHIGFDDLVALKFLRPEFATHQEAVSRFTIEARASFRLRSEHVARMLDVDIHDGVPFIAMELLEGTDLRNLLEARRVLDVAPTVDYLLQTCEALAAAHAIGVIHRDIKPENLFLLGNGDPTDHLKVLDFGISKVAVRGDNRKTHQALTRMAVGTPPYMSPEQVRASSALDARSDIWSVGCVLYELLTGTAPFDRVSLMQACAAVLEDEPPGAHELNTEVPAELSEVIMRCLRKDPNQRFEDVAALAEALNPFGSGRFASYAARCRAHLAGEGMGRRSTPTSFASVPRNTLPPGAPAPGRSITVRLESHAPLTRRVTHAPGLKEPSQPQPLPVIPAPIKQIPVIHPTLSSLNTRPIVAAETERRVVAPLDNDTASDDAAAFRAPRRRAVQVLAWGVPIVVGGLLATYLATAEQRARSTTGPSLHAVQPSATEAHAATDPAQDAADPKEAHVTKDALENLPTGSVGTPMLGAASADELAQAAGNAPPRAAANDAAGTHAERGLSPSAARSGSLGSASKKPTDSKSKARTSTRPTVAPVKPAEILAAPQPQSDPDVGF